MAKFNTGDSVVINEKGADPLCLVGEKGKISCSYIWGQTGMVKGIADTFVPDVRPLPIGAEPGPPRVAYKVQTTLAGRDDTHDVHEVPEDWLIAVEP